ncbi:MerR family transcriptional regulator [Sporosarcina koreensis]|uniref:MerR family transcriptional regulator n=1 Tax=Bacillales TaxID=1385 RepID=UPI000753BFEF|nr:MerR family transcriptional regulator [Sporosarcina koreensis]
MKVKEVADLTGVSVRTLHHYDEIGLLVPDNVTEAGYRVYSDENLTTLQQILFFREVGFPLKKIKELLDSPSFNRLEAFELQRDMLVAKRRQLETMIETIDKTLQSERGEMTMTNEERFKGFDFSSNPYEQEARDRWGDEAVDKANQNVSKFGEKEQEEMNRIYSNLAALRGTDPAAAEAQAAISDWYMFLNKIGDYSMEAFAGLGEMYVADERFTKNIDQFGEGLAVFMRDAMKAYSESK